jgi:hypothetical protein
MFVINLIEGRIFNHITEVDCLHNEYPIRRKQGGNAPNDAMKFLKMKEHTGCGN